MLGFHELMLNGVTALIMLNHWNYKLETWYDNVMHLEYENIIQDRT